MPRHAQRERVAAAVAALLSAGLVSCWLSRGALASAQAVANRLPSGPKGRPSSKEEAKAAVVAVDGHGEEFEDLKRGAAARGLTVLELWSRVGSGNAGPGAGQGSWGDWVEQLVTPVTAVLAYSDFFALPMAEEIAAAAGLLGGSGDPKRDTRLRFARRDKYLMQMEVGKAGLAATQQILARSPAEVRGFADGRASHKAVIKPFVGMRGLNVSLLDYDQAAGEADEAVRRVFATRPAEAGETPLLVQELLEGDEYAVDMVARDGEVVVAALFKYDRRPVGDSDFVMFGSLIVPVTEGSQEEEVALYAAKVLGPLGLRNGAAHVEVKFTPDRGPVLVEANCNRFNGDYLLFDVAERCIGYSQVDVLLDAADRSLSTDAWLARYPALPPAALRACGGVAELHVYQEGVYEGGDEEAIQQIMALDSVFKLIGGPAGIEVGQRVKATENKATVPGIIGLLSDSEDQLMADYHRIFELEKGMFRTH